MVYLNVYDTIFEYLEEIGIVNDVFEHAEEILEPVLDSMKINELRNDLIIEFSIFTYSYKNKLLIEFLSKNLYPKLNEEEKKEFDLIRESKRFNLKFDKKDKTGKLDTHGKELYDVYFTDIDKNETKLVSSSTALDELKFDLNARLIKSPRDNSKYMIIGGIFDKKTFEALSMLASLNLAKKL